MSQLTIAEKLYALRSLTFKDIPRPFLTDIHSWCIKAGESYDTSAFTEKDEERISQIYHRNFE